MYTDLAFVINNSNVLYTCNKKVKNEGIFFNFSIFFQIFVFRSSYLIVSEVQCLGLFYYSKSNQIIMFLN